MIYLCTQIRHIHSSRYSALASPLSGGVRRGPFSTQEREKALEAVRAVTQPKVCITNTVCNSRQKIFEMCGSPELNGEI